MPREIIHQINPDEDQSDFVAISAELLTHQECKICGNSLPLTEAHFYRDNRQRTGFRNTCKECLEEKKEAKSNKEIEHRVQRMDLKMLETLERMAAQKDSSVPHLAKLVEVGMQCYGGLTSFMQQMYANRLAAKPGSKERLQYDMVLIRAITELFRKDTVKVPVDLLDDEDLDKEIEKRMKSQLRLMAPGLDETDKEAM